MAVQTSGRGCGCRALPSVVPDAPGGPPLTVELAALLAVPETAAGLPRGHVEAWWARDNRRVHLSEATCLRARRCCLRMGDVNWLGEVTTSRAQATWPCSSNDTCQTPRARCSCTSVHASRPLQPSNGTMRHVMHHSPKTLAGVLSHMFMVRGTMWRHMVPSGLSPERGPPMHTGR